MKKQIDHTKRHKGIEDCYNHPECLFWCGRKTGTSVGTDEPNGHSDILGKEQKNEWDWDNINFKKEVYSILDKICPNWNSKKNCFTREEIIAADLFNLLSQKETDVMADLKWRYEQLMTELRNETNFEKEKALAEQKEEFISGKRCLSCGRRKENNLSDSCSECLENL